jgi:large subunit ribosomal protein L23
MKKHKVLVRPLFTEKIAYLQDAQNKFAFEVDRTANKIEIKKEVELRFNVKVVDVNTMRMPGKMRQQMTKSGRFYGRRPEWKKAVVTLAQGEKIEMFENA